MKHKIKRLYSIDNFKHPDIIQIVDENEKIVAEFISENYSLESLVNNEKKAQKYINEIL